MKAKQQGEYWLNSQGEKVCSIYETACNCGCGLNSVSQEVIDMFSDIKKAIGENANIRITSACRCKNHNAEVGGSKHSKHLPDKDGICHAIDFTIIFPILPLKFIYLYLLNKYPNSKGMGYYPFNNIIHIDDRPNKVRWVKMTHQYTYITDQQFIRKFIYDRNLF